MKVRVKICGITRVEDALPAARAGADAIGLVFAASPRRVTVAEAAEVVSHLPSFVCPVGVFVDADVEEVKDTAARAGLHCVQLHGGESPEYLARLGGLSVIKAIRVRDAGDVKAAAAYESAAVLLDTASSLAAGGTGETFPWRYAAGLAAERPVILAGGLNADNVVEAIRTAHPWAVDVSSGVEERAGVKSAEKVREFVRRVWSVEDAQGQT